MEYPLTVLGLATLEVVTRSPDFDLELGPFSLLCHQEVFIECLSDQYSVDD